MNGQDSQAAFLMVRSGICMMAPSHVAHRGVSNIDTCHIIPTQQLIPKTGDCCSFGVVGNRSLSGRKNIWF